MADKQDVDLDQIWKGDLFDRRNEAAQLEAYIEALAGRPALREDKHAFTIAVDAAYGEGKTFFLERVAQQLALNHPVAFVDAWADDLADEPLTALAATLKRALAPYAARGDVASRLSAFMDKAGRVAKIASYGLVRRALSLALTGVAVGEIEEVFAETSEAVRGAVEGGIADANGELVGETAQAVVEITSSDLMGQRVEQFEKGCEAIRAMKESLSSIVEALDSTNGKPPIVIIIDELDRCRPNYAVKLLEEIKHLFDVPGLVFVLGMHGRQLAHSVSGAYGSAFDGRAYLRRFIDRELSLAPPSLEPLLEQLCDATGISFERLGFEAIKTEKGRIPSGVHGVLAAYMKMYDLSPRDSFQLVHILQTSIALAQGNQLQGIYLVPLVIGHIINLPRGSLPKVVHDLPLRFHRVYGYPQKRIELPFDAAAEDFQTAANLSDAAIHDALERAASLGVIAVSNTRAWNEVPRPIWDISRYPDLIATVGRFTNPSLLPAKAELSQ